ncbi:MAG TPA: class I SAM-dependent methyltransferase [Terriglobales bacterium]|jgi:SAM-dependent methyltransferase|nr:class I SAM-dependent methyltransferase [Terriglobales bacterium]
MIQQEMTAVQPPEETGERLVPAVHPGETLQQHAARYMFAARYCAGKQVLDVASGLGYGTDYLRRQGADVVGLEIDIAAVQYSQYQYPSSTFVHGNAEAMPGKWSHSFDVIVSFETIEHLERPQDFLQGVVRCLRPGGLFICSTPNKSLYPFDNQNPFHVREFQLGEFVHFIGSFLHVQQLLGQSFHPRWQVLFTAIRGLVRRMLRAFHVPPLGVSRALSKAESPSPFEGNSIVTEKVVPEFLPCGIPRNSVPAFLVVVAEESSK